jgi:hypothetical protein
MSQQPSLEALPPEDLAAVSGGMQGAGAMQLIGSLLGGLRKGGGGDEGGDPQAAEAPAAQQGGGFPIDQIAAFASNPSLQSGMALVTSLMQKRQQ